MKKKRKRSGKDHDDAPPTSAPQVDAPTLDREPKKKKKGKRINEDVVMATEPQKKKKKKSKGKHNDDDVPALRTTQPKTKGTPYNSIDDVTTTKKKKKKTKSTHSNNDEAKSCSHNKTKLAEASPVITVDNAPSYTPCSSFTDAGFSLPLLQATSTFTNPSPIQSHCWPLIATRRDIVGIAATGSGKTLAFGLPALQRLHNNNNNTNNNNTNNNNTTTTPRVLILAPTRELACQTADVLSAAAAPINASVICLYGGVPRKEQIQVVKRGVHVVVGTPGRVQDLLQDGCLRLGAVSYAVLDEADRMLDLGFEPSVRAILAATAPTRQTLMFSATWPAAVRALAGEFMSNPIKVTVGSEALSANHSVAQVVEVVDMGAKEGRLLSLLAQHKAKKTIVFVLYKKEASRMEAFLQRKGWRVAAVHGDLSQQARSQAVESFKAGHAPLLLATDVAARGLDIPDVDLVINYSFPLTTEDYVHRCVYCCLWWHVYDNNNTGLVGLGVLAKRAPRTRCFAGRRTRHVLVSSSTCCARQGSPCHQSCSSLARR